MQPDRTSFAQDLEAALIAPNPLFRIHEVLRNVLIMEPVVWESQEQRLIREIAQRVDAADTSNGRILRLAQDVQCLLKSASSNDQVALLLEVIAERGRVSNVIRKYLDGKISRTGFLSFVAEQRWPDTVRKKVVELSKESLVKMSHALEQADILQLEAILSA